MRYTGYKGYEVYRLNWRIREKWRKVERLYKRIWV